MRRASLALFISLLIFWPAIAAAEGARSFLLTLAGIQTKARSDPFFQLTVDPQQLAKDADAITVAVESYGIPWKAFADSETPPDHLWTTAMRDMARSMRATGKPLILQLAMTRAKMIDLAMADDSLNPDTGWPSSCYDFSKRDGKFALAYTRYAVWMVRQFQPVQVIHAVEVNDYLRGCGAGEGWDSVVAASNQAFDAIKQVSPDVPVYPSFVLSPLYGDKLSGFDAEHYNQLSGLKRDRFALSVYPQVFRLPGDKQPRPSDLPEDFLTRVYSHNPAEKSLVIAETGWNSDTLALGTPDACAAAALPSDEATVVHYLDWLLAQAEAKHVTLVTWWSHHDLMPGSVMSTCYPEIGLFSRSACKEEFYCLAANVFRNSFPKPVGDIIYKIFGSMGLYDYEGRPKPKLLSVWHQALKKPYLGR